MHKTRQNLAQKLADNNSIVFLLTGNVVAA